MSPTLSPVLRGAVRPRVEYSRLAVDNLAEEAIDLSLAAGLPLEPWQENGLRTMLGVRSDGQWSCFEYGEIVPRQNGKTAEAMARALAGLFLLGERTIVWSAHEYRTAMRSFRDMRVLIAALGDVAGPNLINVGDIPVKVNNTNGEESFERLDTGQQIKLVARSKGAGRGFSIDLLVIDEAFAYTESQQDALMPTLAARPNPQIVYASSPPLSGDTGDVMYSLRRRALTGTDETMGWRDWGAAMELDELMALSPARRAEILDDRQLWAATNPAFGLGRVSEESILRLRRSLSEIGFAREIIGMWPRQISELVGWQAIPEQPWRLRGGLERERPTDQITFGLDASWPDAAFGAITVAGRLEDDDVSVQVVEHRPGTGWMVKRAIELDQSHPDAVFVVDKAGPAGHLLQELEAAGLEVMTPAMAEIARGFARFRAEVMGDEPTLRHYDQSELDDALKAASKRPLGDAFTWARQGEQDISPLTAATMALIGVFEGAATPWVSWG